MRQDLGKYGADQMPCTKDALDKHIQRSVYQAAIWQNSKFSKIPF
jgi:hypothetical protein